MNVVVTGAGGFVEFRARRSRPHSRGDELTNCWNLAADGIAAIHAASAKVIAVAPNPRP